MKLSIIGILLGVLFLVGACDKGGPGPGEFLIEGKVRFLRNGYIKILVRQGEKLVVLDSTEVGSDSTFILKGSIEAPAYAQIDFFGRQKDFLPLTEGIIRIKADGNQNGGFFEAKGTQELDFMNEVTDIHRELLEELESDRQLFTLAFSRGDYEEADSIQADMEAKIGLHHKKLMAFVDRIGTSSLTGVYALNLLDYRRVFEYLDNKAKEIAAKPDPGNHEIEYLSNFNNNRARMLASIEDEKRRKEIEKRLRIGAEFPEISLPDPDGKDRKLSSLRGKVVLVDFWAGWCKPCRMENPNLVAAYKMYKGKGFEIFGVSLDSNKKQWVDAIEKDGLSWTQVSDLLHWNSVVVKDFNIQSIPANYLLDRDGTILAMNLRGEALQQSLEELF